MTAGPAPAAPIHLNCTAAEGVSAPRRATACDAVIWALGQLAPARPVRQGADAPLEEGLSVTLHVTQDLPRRVGAVLRWRDGARDGASPEIATRVMDAELSLDIYRAWAGQLIAAAELPL